METTGLRKDIKMRLTSGDVMLMPCIVPAYRAELDDWQRVKAGKVLRVKITHERETAYHNQFFAILAFTYENLPEQYAELSSFDMFRYWILVKIGYAEVRMIDGITYSRARSLSFIECDQGDFMAKVYNPGINYCAGLLGMSFEELLRASNEWKENKKLYSSRQE